jgi:DNA polymerase-3 subunit epsilon
VPDKRSLIVVDIETTGLDTQFHVPIEVAAINMDTDEILHFVPYLEPVHLGNASPDALRINRYFERGVYKNMLSPGDTNTWYGRLWKMLDGNTFAGSNPRFDAQMLTHTHQAGEVWHHRLADVSAYVAGALGLYPAELPGLADCCERLGVVNEGEHSALGDAKATVECFRKAAALSVPAGRAGHKRAAANA